MIRKWIQKIDNQGFLDFPGYTHQLLADNLLEALDGLDRVHLGQGRVVQLDCDAHFHGLYFCLWRWWFRKILLCDGRLKSEGDGEI